ncbi:MAG: ATP-binding protein, partial [Actinomycetota bacterium]
MARTLGGRLARALGLTAALSVAATAAITLGLLRRYAEQEALRELTRQGDAVAREASEIGPNQARALGRLLLASGNLIAFVGPAGGVTSQDAAAREVASALDLSPALEGRRLQGIVEAAGRDFAYVAIPVAGKRGLNVAVVLARPVGLAREAWTPVLLRVGVAGGLAVALATMGSGVIARRLARPVRRVADATTRVAAGDLAHRVPVEGEDEAAGLARSFNAMAEALMEASRREHEFLATISHELQTPITAIVGYAEAISDGIVVGEQGHREALEVIREEASRLERLVADVMDLARLGAAEFRLETAEVDLARTLREALKAHAGRAAEVGVRLDADIDNHLVTMTDPGRVRQIVTNLVENALRVTPAGGAVHVRGKPLPGGVLIEVADTGPGIGEDDLPHVFERSYLWGLSKEVREVGTGLGLAIVRQLTAAL